MKVQDCSLLIPCRNAARFLPELFKGVLAQQHPFKEIILWDDGSTDGSAAIAKKYGAKVLGSDVSIGPALARNKLVQAASCEWVHLHDADDLIDPAYLESLLACAAPDIDVVACDADWIDEQSRRVIIAWRYRQEEYMQDPTGYLLAHPLGINNCIYRRDTFLAEGGFDPTLVPWEDADFHVRLAFAGRKFTFVPGVLTWSARHAGGISMDYVRNWQARLRCLRRYAELMPSKQYPVIAAEAEKAARSLLSLGQFADARSAVSLATSLGGVLPTSRHPVIRFLRAFIPPYLLLRWQERART
jgi:glycosyltransferase involved in cell wall biosynthesis